eukprot:scaffold4285_cov109-Isochrysis_galbana.AAC.9
MSPSVTRPHLLAERECKLVVVRPRRVWNSFLPRAVQPKLDHTQHEPADSPQDTPFSAAGSAIELERDHGASDAQH